MLHKPLSLAGAAFHRTRRWPTGESANVGERSIVKRTDAKDDAPIGGLNEGLSRGRSVVSGLQRKRALGSGWGTWIRTKTNRVRVCCATVTPFPKDGRGAHIEALNASVQSFPQARAGFPRRAPGARRRPRFSPAPVRIPGVRPDHGPAPPVHRIRSSHRSSGSRRPEPSRGS